MKCTACEGVAHPATGCQYTATVIVCGPCTRTFWDWVRGHTNRVYRSGALSVPKAERRYVSFYEAAGRR